MKQAPIELDHLDEIHLNDPQDSNDLPWPPLAEYLEEYYRQLGSQGEGLKTYFKEFDEKLEGLRGIVIIGGEPGSGKTALALQIGFDTALDSVPVVFYSFEMPKFQLVTRLFQRTGKILYRTMQGPIDTIEPLERFSEAKKVIGKAANYIIIRDTKDFFGKSDNVAVNPVFDFGEEIRQLKQVKNQFGTPPLVIIDSLHEIPVDIKYSGDLKKKIDYIMLNLRNMCDQTGATFLLISHQSRNGQANGGLQSFLGSASIEYTVDMALTIAMPDPAKSRTDDIRELIVAKNRYGTKPKALLIFEGKYMDFTFEQMLS